MTELTEIDGVGPSYAETLADAGYETAEDVADADPEEIDSVVERADGEELVATAQALSLSDDITETEDEEEDADDDRIELEPGLSNDQENQLLRALVRVEMRNRRTNSIEAVDEIRDAIEQVKDGEPYELTLRQCDHAYTGTNQLEQEMRSDRNINDFVSEVREVTQVFRKARQENWPDE